MERRILNILEAEANRITPRASVSPLPKPIRFVLESVIPSGAPKGRSRGTGSPESSLSGVGGIPAFRDAHATRLLRWTPIAAFAALTVAALIPLTTRRHTPATTLTSTHQTTTQTPAPQPPITTTATAQAGHHAIAPARPTQPRRIEISQPEEAAPLSHPAPPIPLTAQERLLLRYARRRRTDDLAQISNDRKAAKEEQEAAEFQAFFTPPEIPLGESE
jgi:hypothetical protein